MSKTVAVIVAFFVVATITVRPAEAQTGIVAEVPAADYSFGQHITFHLVATAPTTITEINLFFRVEGQTDITAVPVPFEPGSQVAVDYPYSLAGWDLPPFATVTFWWEIHDEAGQRQLSEERLLYYADNRYDWQTLRSENGDISWEVYWVQGDVVFGQTAINVGVKALDKIHRDLRAPVPGVIRMYIYPTEEDLQSALNLAGYEWAGGQARPELGALLVGVPDTSIASSEMERLIPHELTHLLVYEATGGTSVYVPPWLNEGLASIYELQLDPDRDALVDEALAEDGLHPLVALCGPFPGDEGAARLAYAQSASVVHYLREEYGSRVIRDLLAAYADNATCEAGVNRVLGKSLTGLESAWLGYITRQGQLVVALNDSGVWLALWLLTAVLVLPLVGAMRRGGDKAGTAS